METQYYTTMADVITAVDQALQTSDGYPHAYDIEAIAEKVAVWNNDKHAFEIVDTEEFWAIVWDTITDED